MRYPELDLDRTPVGIFGRITGLDTPLRDGDRIHLGAWTELRVVRDA